jgi:phage gp45-like
MSIGRSRMAFHPCRPPAPLLSLGGRGDRMLALGFEHKDHRPKNTPEGGTVIYDTNGNIASIVKDNIRIAHSKKITLVVGSVSIEITTSGIVLNGNVDLGGTGGLPVDRTDNNPSSKVKAI